MGEGRHAYEQLRLKFLLVSCITDFGKISRTGGGERENLRKTPWRMKPSRKLEGIIVKSTRHLRKSKTGGSGQTFGFYF